MMTQKLFESILNSFPTRRVAVLGDMMLDVYLWGRVNRISPEAPVPIVNIQKRTSCLGGAANVMRNIATLGASSYAYGVVGDDATAEEVYRELNACRIDVAGVGRDPARRTTEKRRVIAGSQQLFREDYEDLFPVDDALRRKLVDGIVGRIRAGELDAVIFEDYNKGVLAEWMLEEIVAAARAAGIVTALDPKPGSMRPVRNLTVMKPNRSEAFALAGVADRNPDLPPLTDPVLAEVAAKLLEEWAPEYLLISLASQGMALFQANRPPQVIPTRAREVFDVSGAGDTVTATFALALVSGATPEEAAELANRAAGVVVAKVGTVPIHLDELRSALNGSNLRNS